ncbi:MAG: iron chelate uptake ABC transporter family permease subunit, partial [Planctomycetes bacterium]|nr:iron chelate uptake ABC transporter family permease subunit [Planctomycetota bacterium]
ATLALLLLGTLLAALAVALAGVIGFVGLLVPHCLRLLCGARHRRLAVLSFLGGGVFLMNCDTLSRSVFAAREIPVGVVTAMVGGPLFIWMLLRKKV